LKYTIKNSVELGQKDSRGKGGGHNGHRGTKSWPNCERTYWLRLV